MTAPHCTIWSAVIASAAVPPVIQPQPLMEKLGPGHLRPMAEGRSGVSDLDLLQVRCGKMEVLKVTIIAVIDA